MYTMTWNYVVGSPADVLDLNPTSAAKSGGNSPNMSATLDFEQNLVYGIGYETESLADMVQLYGGVVSASTIKYNTLVMLEGESPKQDGISIEAQGRGAVVDNTYIHYNVVIEPDYNNGQPDNPPLGSYAIDILVGTYNAGRVTLMMRDRCSASIRRPARRRIYTHSVKRLISASIRMAALSRSITGFSVCWVTAAPRTEGWCSRSM